MVNCMVIQGSVVERDLEYGYESVLNDAYTNLTETEYKHLMDIAHIGYEYATQKADYVEELNDIVCDWVCEVRRSALHITQNSVKIDMKNVYNEANRRTIQMDEKQGFNEIPALFVGFGAIVLSLFCVSATILTTGILQKSFLINPVYLLMLCIGFLGLLLTDIVAVAEWRKGNNV